MTAKKTKMKKSERTRLAILEAARIAFRENSYDQVGLRGIAAKAKVTAALINRYFGNKQKLFREVLRDDAPYAELFSAPRSQLGARMARFLMSGNAQTEAGETLSLDIDQFIVFSRSLGCAEAAPALKEDVETISVPLAQAIGGPMAEEKAKLVMSLVLGFVLFHRNSSKDSIISHDYRVIEEQLAASLQAVIDTGN